MAYRIEELDSLGDALRTCLINAGVKTTQNLLTRCATAKGRAELARGSGLKEADILHCIHFADLLRVKRVGDGYANLLIAAGITSVTKLRALDGDALAARLAAAKKAAKSVDRLPSRRDIDIWIEDAATLPPLAT